MIKLSNITKIYNSNGIETNALNGVSLEIEKGETVAIMGTSGSGKSTLLNMLGAMDTITTWEYYYKDIPVHNLKKTALEKFRKNHISFVFQQFALINDYTVFENVELPLRARNIPFKQRRQMVMNCLEQFGIEDLHKKLPTKIASGQQQRCAIARVVVSGCDVILADETTGALDSRTGQEIINILLELSKEDKTVIIVTHDINIAKKANRIYYIEDGIGSEDNPPAVLDKTE